jgi:uncharacterized membrane protein
VASIVLTPADRKRIATAIKAAEVGHRGEIIVHLEPRSFGDPLRRAAKLFGKLGADKTAEATGVLLYLATANRAAAVWAGAGIAGGADLATWKPVFEALSAGRAGTDPTAMICDAIAALGRILMERAAGPDVHGNELGDGVSS